MRNETPSNERPIQVAENHNLHLLLHFDINETILIGDDAGGDTYEQCIHKIIAKSAFVQCNSTIVHNNSDKNRQRNNTITSNTSNSNTTNDPSLATKKSSQSLSYQQRKYTSKVLPTHWWDGTPIMGQQHTNNTKSSSESMQQQRRGKMMNHQESSLKTTAHNNDTKIDDPVKLLSSIRPLLWTQWEWPQSSSPPSSYNSVACCPYYRTSKKKRSSDFVHHDGSIYYSVYEYINRLLHPHRFLHNKKHSTDSSKNIPATSMNRDYNNTIDHINNVAIESCPKTKQTLAQMLPAFFDTLIALCSNDYGSTNSRPSQITIVLRTFGTDLQYVMNAIHLFIRGQHPEYTDPSVLNELQNSIYIHDEAIYGRWKQRDATTEKTYDSNEETINQQHEYHLLRKEDKCNNNTNNSNSVIAAGDHHVVQWLHQLHGKYNTNDNKPYNKKKIVICGMQDDYDHWSKYYCAPYAGKPIWKLLPRTTTPAKSVNGNRNSSDDSKKDTDRISHTHHHHVLFDDNIHNLEHNSIACVRQEVEMINDRATIDTLSPCTTTGATMFRTLSGMETIEQHGLFIIRVPTIEPIFNRRWFIDQIENILSKIMK